MIDLGRAAPESMIPSKVKSVLDRFGLEALEFEPGSTPTSEMAARQIGVETAQIAKSILVKGRNEVYYLVVCPGNARLSNRKLKSTLGGKVRMATAQETVNETGFSPGGVCPFGLDAIEIFVDRKLEDYGTIYPAAGTDGSGVPITYRKLCEIAAGRPCDVCD